MNKIRIEFQEIWISNVSAELRIKLNVKYNDLKGILHWNWNEKKKDFTFENAKQTWNTQFKVHSFDGITQTQPKTKRLNFCCGFGQLYK